jgi:hypothetical protein
MPARNDSSLRFDLPLPAPADDASIGRYFGQAMLDARSKRLTTM